MKIILKNGIEYDCTATSTINSIVIPVDRFGAIDAIREEMTEDALSYVVLGDVRYLNVVLEGISASISNGVILASFKCRLGIEDQLSQARQEAIDDYTLQLIEEGLL